MSKVIKIVLGIVVIAVLALSGIKAVKDAQARDKQIPPAIIYPITVKIIVPEIKKVKLTLPYLAEVYNDKDVVLSSRISSRIKNIKKSGSRVKKGDVVATLDTTTIKGNLSSVNDQIKALSINLQNLELTHKRTLDLLKVQGASIEQSQKEETQLANIKAQIASLQQKHIELKNNLSYAVITSPVDGVIAKVQSTKGSVAMPGKPLASISSKNGFYLLVRVPRDIAIKGVVFNNKDYEVTSLGSTYHGLLEYKVYLNDTNLISGDRVEIDVITYKDNGVLVPFDAILSKEKHNYIIEVKNNKPKVKQITIIQSAQQGVLVDTTVKGLKIVVAKPDILLRLSSGYKLKIEE